MSATATFTITTMSLPPPTLNLLDANQRTRLIKSTRKLGKVLGTTPYVVETPDLLRPTRTFTRPDIPIKVKEDTLQRSRSLSSASFQTSSTMTADSETFLLPIMEKPTKKSLPASEPAKMKSLPGTSKRHAILPQTQPLVQPPHHPRTFQSQASRERLTPQCLPALVVPSKSQLQLQRELSTPVAPPRSTEPLSPGLLDESSFDSASARRRKMDKLTRHLGELVPSELVFPHAPCVSEAPRPILHHQYSRSLLDGKENLNSSIRSTPDLAPKRGFDRRSRSLSILIPSAPSTPLHSAFTDEPTEYSYFLAYKPETNIPKTRRERRHGWSGEWNRSDMQDVVKYLRELK